MLVDLRPGHDKALLSCRQRTSDWLDRVDCEHVYDVGEENGQAYIVCELVSGGMLTSLLARGPLPVHRGFERGSTESSV